MGTGRRVAADAAQVAVQGRARDWAAARATARLTPRMALAPSLALFGVPSRSSMAPSTAAWSSASIPARALAIFALTLSTALQDTLAAVAGLVGVAELQGFVNAGRGAGGDRGPPGGAALQADLDLDGRVPARIQNLSRVNLDDA